MKTTCQCFSPLFAFFCLISISASASSVSKNILGVAPQDADFYQSDVIKCKDESKYFERERINDDFCDCPDGTDEPGTSACPDGKFYCHNIGHIPLILFSSRVNDGICDCCDGTDEYAGKVKCPNNCWEASQAVKDKLRKNIEMYQVGVNVRKKEVESAKLAISNVKAELSKLKNDEKILKGLVEQLKDYKDQIKKVEEQEQLEREKEDEKLKEAQKEESEHTEQLAEASKESTMEVLVEAPLSSDQDVGNKSMTFDVENDDKTGCEESSPCAEKKNVVKDDEKLVKDETSYDLVADGMAHSNHLKEKKGKPEDAEGLSKEELGRLVASRWTGENREQRGHESVEEKMDFEHESEPETLEDVEDDDYDLYDSDEIDDEYEDYSAASHTSDIEDEDGFSYTADLAEESWLDKIQESVQNISQALNILQTPINKSEAAFVREEYNNANQKLDQLQSRISRLSNKLKRDFGKEKEFYSFYGVCFESKLKKYAYKVCPYRHAVQIEDRSTTKLGEWDGFNDDYTVMEFSDGDDCWNGPKRSIKVKLRCGLKNELKDVDEPSRCEYVAWLSTPALCLQENLKELQDELDLKNELQRELDVMNIEQPHIHDEL